MRFLPYSRQERLAIYADTAAGHQGDVPLVPPGRLDARPQAANGLRSIRGVAVVSSHEPLQDDARAQGITTLVELLAYRAERQHDDVVFRFVSGDGVEDGRLTFGELRRRGRDIAAGLRSYS